MPDFNPLAAPMPVIRPELVSAGLSLIVQPKYDYINTFPDTLNADISGFQNAFSMTQPDEGINRRKRLLGQVPLTPAAETDYNTAKRYDRADLGFVAGRDNEDLYAQNQGFFNSVGHGLGRLVGMTVTKTGTGLGYLAGLVGIGNDSEKYGNGFGAWIAGAGDNGIAKWFQGIEDDKIKNDWFPIYKKATEADHGFFRHMGDLDFWTDDLTDGMAFIASSFIPGMAVSKLNLGAKTMKSLAALRGLGYADEASALARTGVEGTVESQNLLREGLGATVESPDIANTIKQTQTATQEIPRVLSWIDNAKAMRSIDVGTTSIINTASQAMYSANEAKNNVYETLIRQKDENGNNKYTADQAKQVAAKVAKDSYLMNLGALSLMNLWEANFLFKKPEIANRLTGKFATEGLMSDATLAKRSFGERAYESLKEPVKGFLTGGAWLGNMQLAIDRLNNNPDNFNLDFGDKLKSLGKNYVQQTKDAFTGKDMDAQKALGIGGLLAVGVGKLLGHNNLSETKKSLANLNTQVSAFRELGNIYRINEDGSVYLEDGAPVLDEDKARSWVASMNNVLNINQLANNFESKNIPELAKLYRSELFARYAKAHFDAGLSDVLRQKLTDVKNIKPEDLTLLGFNAYGRTPEEVSNIHSGLMKQADTLEDLYNNIHQNFIPTGINMNSKEGRQKYFDITDKMYYLSSRSQIMSDLTESANAKYHAAMDNAEKYDESYNTENDAVVTKYNELFEKAESAKRYQQISTEREYENDRLNGIVANNEGTESGKNIPSDSNSDNISNRFVENSQKELNEYVAENKEILQRMKKDSRGRYLYEVANKNLLPSVKEMEKQQIVQAELALSQSATLNVLSRLADPQYGVKYYDQIYSKELEKHAAQNDLYSDLTDDDTSAVAQQAAQEDTYNLPSERKRGFDKLDKEEAYNTWTNQFPENRDTTDREAFEDQLNNAIDPLRGKDPSLISDEVLEDIYDRTKALRSFGDKEKVLEAMKEELNIDEDRPLNDIEDELFDVSRERDALESKEDRSLEEEQRLQELNDEIGTLEAQRETAFATIKTQQTIDNSANIKPEDKPKYSDVLKKINKVRKGIVKFDDRYEVNGETYRKVTDLIGDTIPPELREDPSTQAAVSAGNTVDSLVKAYFGGQLNDEFRNSLGDRISDESYNKVVKSLDKIKSQLANKGIEIVGSNVYVVDNALKVAGELDLLGVDKDGNFKIFEIQARRPDVYRQYGKRGLGVKIRDLDGKRLSMYRNMFANQYGVIPDEISVKFPFEVKYDRTNPIGFIDDLKLKDPIRFTPLKNVEIKMKASEPLRIGSKFESIDMTRIFLDTFLPDKLAQDKLKFLFRNVKPETLFKNTKITVKPAAPEFQERYRRQQEAFNNPESNSTGYQIKKFTDYRNRDEYGNPREFKNLYSLVGNTEISLSHDGQPIGYFSPVQTLAYKDTDGNFKILDENTDAETYQNVTGNSLDSYNEFRKVAAAYKKLHTELTGQMLASPDKQITLSTDDLSGVMSLKMSYGELDLVKRGGTRPDLKNLAISGVKVGGKSVPTVINVDSNDAIKVLMDNTKKNRNTISKYQTVDRWANQNLDLIKAAITDQDGERLTDNVAVIETPDGSFKLISLRAKNGVDLSTEQDFVKDLGSKFTAATTEKVFKNQGIMVVPKESMKVETLGLKSHEALSKVYETEDIDTLEKYIPDSSSRDTAEEVRIRNEQRVDDFLGNLSDKDRQTLEDFRLTRKEDILNDYENGDWSSMEEYIENIKNCK